MNDEDQEAYKALEDMILARGAKDFDALTSMLDVYCPFEATGMVGQEIRHSNFLAYILDPARPHGFDDAVLRAMLLCLADIPISLPRGTGKLDIHLAELGQVRVHREWKSIDLLIEVPKGCVAQDSGWVIAIEIKIDASEGETQLGEYVAAVETHYPQAEWEHSFVFLTKSGEEPSQEIWAAAGFSDIMAAFEDTLSDLPASSPALPTLKSYIEMMRRHHLENPKLEALARKLWQEHRTALDKLMEFRPDEETAFFNELREFNFGNDDTGYGAFASFVSSQLDLDELIADQRSGFKELKFAIKSWASFGITEGGVNSWISTSSLLAITLGKNGNGDIEARIILGPGDQSKREAIHKAYFGSDLRMKGTRTLNAKWNTLWSKRLLTAEQLAEIVQNDGPTNAAKRAGEALANALKQQCPAYQAMIEKVDASYQG